MCQIPNEDITLICHIATKENRRTDLLILCLYGIETRGYNNAFVTST